MSVATWFSEESWRRPQPQYAPDSIERQLRDAWAASPESKGTYVTHADMVAAMQQVGIRAGILPKE